jgi:hypothetical protein
MYTLSLHDALPILGPFDDVITKFYFTYILMEDPK